MKLHSFSLNSILCRSVFIYPKIYSRVPQVLCSRHTVYVFLCLPMRALRKSEHHFPFGTEFFSFPNEYSRGYSGELAVPLLYVYDHMKGLEISNSICLISVQICFIVIEIYWKELLKGRTHNSLKRPLEK